MIRSISANKPEFETIRFQSGFNVVLADRDPSATNQQSRNARGKTSLLLVLNYLLGGSLNADLKPLADDEWSFTLTIDLFGYEVAVSRDLASGARMKISYPSELDSVLSAYVSEGFIKLDDWIDLLGLALFRLEPSEEAKSDGISIRTLLSYVVRANRPSDPLKFFPSQPANSVRRHISFLLGLDWRVVRDLQVVNHRLEGLQAVIRTTREGVVDSLRSADELALERSTAQNAVDEMAERVHGFRVLEDPENLVLRADAMTTHITSLRDQAYVERRMESLYQASLHDGQSTDSTEDEEIVLNIYRSAGALFAPEARRRLEQVKAFRLNLLSNRQEFLELELSSVRSRLAQINAELAVLDEQRENLMLTLRAGGALDELVAMQTEYAMLLSNVRVFDAQIEQSREIAASADQLKLEKAELRIEATKKLADERRKVDQVSDRFRAKMKRLYNVDAAISVSVDDDGYLFAVKVPSSASGAVSRMGLFCFDMTLLEEGVATGHHPDFVVHDSSVFEGVDPRQRASALHFANDIASSLHGQYICTLNSNDVPDDIAAEDWFTNGIVRTVLDTDEGGLFGRTF